MQTINIHEAKTHLSRLVELAAKGEPFIIAKAGKPMVKVSALNTKEAQAPRRIGFLRGQGKVPDAKTFNEMGRKEIEAMFYGDE